MDNFQKEVPTVFKKYKVVKKIGQGAFGAVYEGNIIDDGGKVAIKVEKKNLIKKSALESEAFLLKDLKDIGIPEVLSYGLVKNYRVLIEPLLGKDLFSLYIQNGMYFPLEDICLISIQILERIQYVHSRYIIHRDIKPDNFLIGKKDPNIIYLVDFGLSKKYRSSITKKHVKFSLTKKLTGTVRFSSPNALRGGEQSRKDDLISIGYMIIFFMKKELPWQRIRAKNDIERITKVYINKKQLKPEILCESLPEEMTEYIKYVYNLEFEQNPDYKYLKGLFQTILKKKKLDCDNLIFSWINQKDFGKIIPRTNLHERRLTPRKRLMQQLIQNSHQKKREISSGSDNNSYKSAPKMNIISPNMRVVRNDSKDILDVPAQVTQNNSKIKNTNTLILNFEKTMNNQLLASFEEIDNHLEKKDILIKNKEIITFKKEKLNANNANILNNLTQNKNEKFINSELNGNKNNLKPKDILNQKNNKNKEFFDIYMNDNKFNIGNKVEYKENINLTTDNKLSKKIKAELKITNNEINSIQNFDFKKQKNFDIINLLQNNEEEFDKFQENNKLRNKNTNPNLKCNNFLNKDLNQRKINEDMKNDINVKEGKKQNKKRLIDNNVINTVNTLYNEEKTNKKLKSNNIKNKDSNNKNNTKMLYKQNDNSQARIEKLNNINIENLPRKNNINKNNGKNKNNLINQNKLNIENISNIQKKSFNNNNKNINFNYNPNNTENNKISNELSHIKINKNNIVGNNFHDNYIINTEPTNTEEKKMKIHKNIVYQKNFNNHNNHFYKEFNNFNYDLNNGNNNKFELNLNNKMQKREDNLFPDNLEGIFYTPKKVELLDRKNYLMRFNNIEEIKDYDNQNININIMNNKNRMKKINSQRKMKNVNNLKTNNDMDNKIKMINQNKISNTNKMSNMNNTNNMEYIYQNNDFNKKINLNKNLNTRKNQIQQPNFQKMNLFPDDNNYNFNNQNNNINYNLLHNIQNPDTNFLIYTNFPDYNI